MDEFHRTAARGMQREKREEGDCTRIARLAEETRVRKNMVIVGTKSGDSGEEELKKNRILWSSK